MRVEQQGVVGDIRQILKNLVGVAAIFLATFSSGVSAAMVTTQESGVDAIYSQANFGSDPVDIVFGSILELINPDLLAINNSAEFDQLRTFKALNVPATSVGLFFVDTIHWCGDSGSVAGCANSQIAVVNSTLAAGNVGDELIAHEIGHVLGLDHVGGSTNLMTPSVNDNQSLLTPSQVATIFGDDKLQGNSVSGFFVDVTPILVTAAATVPLPGGLFLLLSAIAPIVMTRLRHR